MKVLFVSSEIYPFAKTGGLADVSASLPKALSNRCDITSIMPLYSSIDQDAFDIQHTGFDFDFEISGISYSFNVFSNGRILFLKDRNNLFNREEIYDDYADNNIRFGIFSYAVLEYIKTSGQHFDIVHINDWQSALIALLAKEHYSLDAKIVLTIHNIAYQGVFPKESIPLLSLKWDYFTPAVLEYHDQVNFLKSGIAESDIVTTVSPSYAKEIQTRRFGASLEYFIQDNSYKLEGILNGIDYSEFSPEVDHYIPYRYDKNTIERKHENKKLLLEELFLTNPEYPLFIFIGRFTAQKGIDQIIEALDHLQALPLNIAILGSGEEHYKYKLASISGIYDNVSITIGYQEELARKFYASGDFLLMPSLYEPCGLNQMIAMKYGTIPIVTNVGGLKDSVNDINTPRAFSLDKGIGFVFEQGDIRALLNAVQRALHLYSDPLNAIKLTLLEQSPKSYANAKFSSAEGSRTDKPCLKSLNLKALKETLTCAHLIAHNMQVDYSWKSSANAYLELYHKLCTGWLPKRMNADVEVPSSYNIDTLKTIALNPRTLFTYWEVTPDLVKQHNTGYSALKLRAYAEDEKIFEEKLSFGIGDYYIHHAIDFKKVCTQIGFYQTDGTFKAILDSNSFIAPNAEVIPSEYIIWRNLTTEECQSKRFILTQKYFYQTKQHLSSQTLAKQHALLEKSHPLSHDNTSATFPMQRTS